MRRCKSKKSDILIGPYHAAIGDYTLCDKEINESWITHTEGENGPITCKKCIKKIKQIIPLG